MTGPGDGPFAHKLARGSSFWWYSRSLYCLVAYYTYTILPPTFIHIGACIVRESKCSLYLENQPLKLPLVDERGLTLGRHT